MCSVLTTSAVPACSTVAVMFEAVATVALKVCYIWTDTSSELIGVCIRALILEWV